MDKNILVLAIALCTLGCETYVEIPPVQAEKKLVVQNRLTVGEVPSMFISSLRNYQDYGSFMGEFMEVGATAIIHHDGIQDTLEFDPVGRKFKGSHELGFGQDAQLSVTLPGFPSVEGSTNIPQPISVSVLSQGYETVQKPWGEEETKYRISLQVEGLSADFAQALWVEYTSNPGSEAGTSPLYYSVFDDRFFSTENTDLNGTENDETFLDGVSFFRPAVPSESVNFTLYLDDAEGFKQVRISAISEETYTYFTKMDLQQHAVGAFTSFSRINGNLIGGEGLMYGLHFSHFELNF